MPSFSSYTAFVPVRWNELKEKNMQLFWHKENDIYYVWSIDDNNNVFCASIWDGEIPWSIGRTQEENDAELTDFKQTVQI